MAKWDSMVQTVEKMKGALASSQEAFRQLQAKVDELQQGMSDEEDQKKVEEFAREFSSIADSLPKAIVANPGDGPAPGTESTGGAD